MMIGPTTDTSPDSSAWKTDSTPRPARNPVGMNHCHPGSRLTVARIRGATARTISQSKMIVMVPLTAPKAG